MNAFATEQESGQAFTPSGKPAKISARNVNVFYGEKHAIKDLSIDIPDRSR